MVVESIDANAWIGVVEIERYAFLPTVRRTIVVRPRVTSNVLLQRETTIGLLVDDPAARWKATRKISGRKMRGTAGALGFCWSCGSCKRHPQLDL